MNLENKPSTLKAEHLNEGFKPIISCLYDRNNIDKETQYFLDDFKKGAEFVNFYYREKDLKEKKMHNFGEETYVISECNEKNKYSFSYLDCTGVVAVGINRITGKNISFISHQNSEAFFEDEEVKLNFKKDLEKSLDDLISHCVPGSIDFTIIGGNKEDVSQKMPGEDFRMGIDDIEAFLKTPYDKYIKSIKYINYILKQKTGLVATVMSGPNDNFETDNHSLSIYFDTQNRRLYMIKPKQEKTSKNEAFEAPDVEDRIKNFNN